MKNLAINKMHSSEAAWFFIKLSLLFFFLSNMFIMMADVSSACPFPVGVCKLNSFSILFSLPGKVLLHVLLLVLAPFYLFEKKMFYVTLGLFFLSCIIISYHESNGRFHHATIFSPIFAAQSFAYWKKRSRPEFDLVQYRVQYSIQMIAATYTLAGISKLATSGFGWINSGEVFALQVVKNYSFIYFAQGTKAALDHGYHIARLMLEHQYLIRFFLASSLLLELFCFAALISNSVRRWYALGLLLMHTGIWLLMGIPFGVVAMPMIIFFLNPLYWLYKQVAGVISSAKV